MFRLDETSLRKPEFTEGVPIVLSDGQTWHLPLPIVGDFYFARTEQGQTVSRQGFLMGPDYEALMDAYLSVKNGMEECCALFDLAFYLITRNYAVTVADCRLLLRVARGSDPANEAMWSKIAMAAMGRAPKAEAGGSEPVSSPTASPNP